MEYIVHRRLRGTAACGSRVNIPYGSRFETIGEFIATPEGKGLAFVTSELAHQYFARNDDGNGIERGKLTCAIAYSPRERKWSDGSVHRFSEDEVEMLEQKWSKYLRDDVDTILFNHDFFNAQVFELRTMAADLHLKVK